MADVYDLIYDWNRADDESPGPKRRILLDDETLRDGLQSPSVLNPPIEAKVRILHLMDALGIDTADVGQPAAGPREYEHTLRLAQEIVTAGLRVAPNCAAGRSSGIFSPSWTSPSGSGAPSRLASTSARVPSGWTSRAGRWTSCSGGSRRP